MRIFEASSETRGRAWTHRFADGSYGEHWNGVSGPVRGLLFGDATQLAAQVVAVVVNATFVFSSAYGFFRLTDRLIGNREIPDAQLQVGDVPIRGGQYLRETQVQFSEFHVRRGPAQPGVRLSGRAEIGQPASHIVFRLRQRSGGLAHFRFGFAQPCEGQLI